jgi:hypothetical protein
LEILPEELVKLELARIQEHIKKWKPKDVNSAVTHPLVTNQSKVDVSGTFLSSFTTDKNFSGY